VAVAARLSRSTVSRIESGRAGSATLDVLERVSRAVGARLDVRLSWNGEALDRRLDADHAAIVERVSRVLRLAGWLVTVEASFNIRGERGSVDVLAFHPLERIVFVVEVKSVVPDIQALLFGLDRKTRLVLSIARERGWVGSQVARLLVIRESRTARRRVEQHRETFEAAFTARSVEVRRWIWAPDATIRFSGLWFLSDDHPANVRHRVSPPRSSAAARRRAGRS
jgi:hypothetical protein